MSRNKTLQSLKELVEQFSRDFEISLTGSGHYAVRLTVSSGARATVFAPSTPSDHRSMLNVKTKLRRATAA